MELTIKHLAPYLPYKLQMIFEGKGGRVITLETLGTSFLGDTLSGGKGGMWLKSCGFKPILRPLSDLTKEIEVNDEKFVPAGKMITHGFHNQFWYDLEKFDYRYLYAMDLEKLISWHFNVFNLPENLFINYNDI